MRDTQVEKRSIVSSTEWVQSIPLKLFFHINRLSDVSPAAICPTPVSITARIGQAPEPYVLTELFGKNMSYATPMTYKNYPNFTIL